VPQPAEMYQPIRNALPIFVRRAEEKAVDQYVFEDHPSRGQRHGARTTYHKAFGRLRERLGIGERLEGQRQASKDLRSHRRRHASKCRDALNAGATGFTMYTLADNLGVWSQPLMGHPYRVIRRMRYGPGSAWERHDDKRLCSASSV
jgi:hypothetical protein